MATILLIMILCVSNIFIVKVKAQENNKDNKWVLKNKKEGVNNE